MYTRSHIGVKMGFESLDTDYVSKLIEIVFSDKIPFNSVLNGFSFQNLKCGRLLQNNHHSSYFYLHTERRPFPYWL